MKTYLVRYNNRRSLIELNPCVYGRLLKSTDMIVEEITDKLAETDWIDPSLIKIDWIEEIEEFDSTICCKRIYESA